jgi:hypothetical protein
VSDLSDWIIVGLLSLAPLLALIIVNAMLRAILAAEARWPDKFIDPPPKALARKRRR